MKNCINKPARGFKKKEFINRSKAIENIFFENSIDAILLTTEADIFYFTGFFTQFWQSPTRPWYVLLTPNSLPLAIIPSIGKKLMESCFVEEIYTWNSPDKDDEGISVLKKVIKNKISNNGKLGLMMGKETSLRMPLKYINEIFYEIKKENIIDVTKEIQKIRMIKSCSEIEKIRYVSNLTSKVFSKVPTWLNQGMTLIDVFKNFKIKLLESGIDDVNYLVGAAGQGGYFDVISPPKDNALKNGDILMMDTGCKWDGYYCDFDRNFALGYATDESILAHELLYKSIYKSLEKISPGITKFSTIFNQMNKILINENQNNLDIGRYGHGLGIQLTEPPSNIFWDDTILEENMVLTLEPSIIYGKENFLMVAEENIVITKNGYDFLSVPISSKLKII